MHLLENKKSILSLFPARTIIISFAIVIVAGALLLMLPIASKDGAFTNPMDALFTSTSATCVTGLVIFDTYAKWSIFGQVVILMLIQIGGLGFVTFASFFNLLISRKLSLRAMQLAQESVNSSSFADINKLLKMVMGLSFTIELVGALLLATAFVPKYGLDGIFISIFLAISAFCNAGFDILGREGEFVSLTNYNDNFIVIFTISALIIIGGLGFVVWQDIINFRKTRHLFLHTKVVLVVTGVLLLTGFLLGLIFEWNNPETMGNLSPLEKINAAFFQSVSTRTAGFNSIEIAPLNGITKLLYIVLMFIGAAPGSTAGGIKVTSLAVVVMTVVGVVKGRADTVVFNRKVSYRVVYKAIAIMILGALLVALSSAIIYFTMGNVTGLDSVFESVSAFGTVGLSAGVSGVANLPSKIILILLMFLGRVGPVSFVFSLAVRASSNQNRKEVIPEGKIMVG